MRSLKIIENQAVAAGKNLVAGEIADIKKQTGIVGTANRIIGETVNGSAQQKLKSPPKEGVYIRHNSVTEGFWDYDEIRTAPDGYVRRTPVQELVVPADYMKKIIRKCIAAAALVGVVVFAVIVIYKLKLFSM